MVYLGELPISIGTVATCVNDNGEAVGYAVDTDFRQHAFLWRGGGLQHLGWLPRWNTAAATSINNLEQVVGSAHLRSGGWRAWLWDAHGLVDLNQRISKSSGWVLQGATSINDAGVIVGYGRHHGERAGFLLRPTQNASC